MYYPAPSLLPRVTGFFIFGVCDLTNEGQHHSDYEEGVRDGRLAALQAAVSAHNEQLKDHSRRLTALERVAWALLGASAILQMPQLSQWLGSGG